MPHNTVTNFYPYEFYVQKTVQVLQFSYDYKNSSIKHQIETIFKIEQLKHYTSYTAVAFSQQILINNTNSGVEILYRLIINTIPVFEIQA